ncbi:MAG: magnesium transporter [Opitutales bacterium]|nr:magnesium transporter [Opitutales bacterium]
MPDLIQDHPIAQQLDQYTFEELNQLFESHFEGLDLEKLARTSPYEISLFLERLTVDEQRTFLRLVSEKNASNILAEMDPENSAEVLSAMREFRAARILELLEADDAADLISKLDESDRIRLLGKINPNKAFVLRKLLRYDPNTAGGVMTPEVATLQENFTIQEALDYIRKTPKKIENLYNLYVLDPNNRLLGLTTLKNLIFSEPQKKVRDIMNTQIQSIACLPETDKVTVANTMAEYNVMDIPVVDEQNRLLGCVTHDDVLDIVQEAATADLQQLHGAGADESIHDPVWYSLKKRNPWLFINLLLASLSAYVISLFNASIEKASWMAAFMTVIANLGGNTGAQTLAVFIRGLALGEFQKGDSWIVCRKELLKGLLNGILIGIFGGIIAIIMTHYWLMGIVVFLSMILTMILSSLMAAVIPLVLRHFHFDPAQSSYIFLTAFTDIAGLFIFLKLGTCFLLPY